METSMPAENLIPILAILAFFGIFAGALDFSARPGRPRSPVQR